MYYVFIVTQLLLGPNGSNHDVVPCTFFRYIRTEPVLNSNGSVGSDSTDNVTACHTLENLGECNEHQPGALTEGTFTTTGEGENCRNNHKTCKESNTCVKKFNPISCCFFYMFIKSCKSTKKLSITEGYFLETLIIFVKNKTTPCKGGNMS